MRRCDIVQSKLLPDHDFHIARYDLGKEMPRHLLAIFMLANMSKERRTGDLQRTFRPQLCQVKRWNWPRSIAESDHHTQRLEAVEGSFKSTLSHRIHHHIDPCTPGQFLDLLFEVFRRVVDTMRCPMVQGQLAFFIAASSANEGNAL